MAATEVVEAAADRLTSSSDDRSVVTVRSSRLYANLHRIASLQLKRLGLPEANIEVRPQCVRCRSPLFFSRPNDRAVEPIVGLIGIKGD